MTELYINNQPVALPEKMSLTIKRQNPLITKNGTFSLDLNLSLKDRNNAALYKHMDRLHFNAGFKGRKALLLSDNRMVLNGVEAIQKNTDKVAQIQLVSGNSELNYFIGSDRYISELDLGEEPPLTDSYLDSLIGKRYPEAGFAPAKVKIDDTIYNDWTGQMYKNPRMQPFLLSMVRRIITGLGYHIVLDEPAEDEMLSSIYFLNSIDSRQYNRMLPGWKAKDFLEECEKFFNIMFDISEHDRSVRIYKYLPDSRFGTIVIDDIIDEYERSYEPQKSEISYNNVKYKFSSSGHKYDDIDPGILSKADIREFDTFARLSAHLQVAPQGWIPTAKAEEFFETLVLFSCKETNTLYIVEPYEYVIEEGYETGSATWYYLRPINRFGKIETDPDARFVELEFVPAQYHSYASGNMWTFATSSVPYQPEKIEDIKDKTNIREYIEDGIKTFDSNKKEIFIAIHNDSSTVPGNIFSSHSSQIDYLQEAPYCLDFVFDNHWTLRLDGPYGLHRRYYRINSRYDDSKEYIIRFITNKLLDPRAEYLICNRLFACKELEYTILNDGIHPIVTGTFFEIK